MSRIAVGRESRGKQTRQQQQQDVQPQQQPVPVAEPVAPPSSSKARVDDWSDSDSEVERYDHLIAKVARVGVTATTAARRAVVYGSPAVAESTSEVLLSRSALKRKYGSAANGHASALESGGGSGASDAGGPTGSGGTASGAAAKRGVAALSVKATESSGRSEVTGVAGGAAARDGSGVPSGASGGGSAGSSLRSRLSLKRKQA